MSYYTDHRVRARERRHDIRPISASLAIITVYEDEYQVPFHYETCSTCSGHGSHVNPSIDCDGLTGEDFDADPGFYEEYMRGRYDVSCFECNGLRVIPALDRDRIHPDILAVIDDHDASERAYDLEVAAERRLGA